MEHLTPKRNLIVMEGMDVNQQREQALSKVGEGIVPASS